MSQSKPIRTIGDKVGAKYKTFYDEKFDRIHSAWIPLIQVDGEMLPIYDESTISGQKEAESRYKALKLARQVRDSLKARMAEKAALLALKGGEESV